MRHNFKMTISSFRKAILTALMLVLFAVSAGPALAQPANQAMAQTASTTPPPNLPQAMQPTALPSGPQDPSGGENYVLGVGERLRLIVFGETTLSGEFVIDSTGKVSLPLIGEVTAQGLSVREFEHNVENELKEGYLNDPRVNAEVLNFRPFYILGEVTHPGQYPYTNSLTVLNAVATAGGFTPLANQTRVYIKHSGQDVEEQVSLSGDTRVQPGDTVRISKGAFYILGEVTRPGEYAYTDGMTALNAIATAGGFTYRANHGRIFIQRQGAADEHSYPLRPNLLVQPGDTIRIGERFF